MYLELDKSSSGTLQMAIIFFFMDQTDLPHAMVQSHHVYDFQISFPEKFSIEKNLEDFIPALMESENAVINFAKEELLKSKNIHSLIPPMTKSSARVALETSNFLQSVAAKLKLLEA